MRSIALWAATGFLATVTPVIGQTNEAQMIVHCMSVRLLPATVSQLGQEYRLEATTALDDTINHEIGIGDDPDYLCGTVLVYTDLQLFMSIPIYCALDIPDPGDANINGISDFFEVNRPVTSAKSSGYVRLDDGSDVYEGTVQLTWNRAAGSATGTCRLQLSLADLGISLTFNHPFEIIDYRGSFTYTISGTNVTANVNLTRQGIPGSYTGPFNLFRIDYEELSYPATGWTNENANVLQWLSTADMEQTILRGGMGTNYFGILGTNDGWPDTGTSDEYYIWLVHIFDAHDADGDLISDLTDDPVLPATPPSLVLRRDGSKLFLRITAKPGLKIAVEQSPTLVSPAWVKSTEVTLTADTQEIELVVPATPAAFWRARVE